MSQPVTPNVTSPVTDNLLAELVQEVKLLREEVKQLREDNRLLIEDKSKPGEQEKPQPDLGSSDKSTSKPRHEFSSIMDALREDQTKQ